MATTVNGIAGLKDLVGQHLGYSDAVEVTQEQVNTFADATGDHQWIHTDPERAKEGPFGGFGIANEKKWGYWVAVLTAAAELALFLPTIVDDGVGAIFNIGLLLQLIFPVALFALLLHPMSRDYQRIWFR